MNILPSKIELEPARPGLHERLLEALGEARRSVRSRQEAYALDGDPLRLIEVERCAVSCEKLFGEVGDADRDGGVDRFLGTVFDRVALVIEGRAVASGLASD